MIIERSTLAYRVFNEDTVLAALQKISANKAGFVIVVDESGRVLGTITDGDIRRWMQNVHVVDVNARLDPLVNPSFVKLQANAPRAQIASQLNERVRFIPLVDEYEHLIAIARLGNVEFSIGGRSIGEGKPVYIIAEIGNNHNGDVELAKRLVDLAVDAGVDCAKFQMRDLERLYADSSLGGVDKDLGAQYTLDLLAKFNLGEQDLFRVFDHCAKKGLEPLCTPWDENSLRALESYGMRAYKVASADFTNHDLLVEMARTGKPLIASTGMTTESEIVSSIELLRRENALFALLHCNSTYPAPYKDVNLRYISRLADMGQCPVGYSGHERGWFVPVAAVAAGARIIEKHFTVDRSMEGNDHRVSLLPDEMRLMVDAIRSTEEALGATSDRVITQGEMMNREVLAKSLYASVDIDKGTIVGDAHITVRSPGQGLQPNMRAKLLGRTANRTIKAGTPFFPSDLEEGASEARAFRFARPWGVPVRWHDYRAMFSATNIDLLEYHLSYKDMEENLDNWFSEALPINFTVHSPELFSGDHVLDLASPDDDYRRKSIEELQRVIDLTRDLRKWHSKATRPLIITNMGGFSTRGFVPVSERKALYARIAESLSYLEKEGIEIIAQTMPPFPWHFGGQSYHNLFMDPDEIVDFCQENNMRICFDVSHSQLSCNYFGWSMVEFCQKVGPFTAHLHIVDAKDTDGEGLQIGDGTMDFAAIAAVLDTTCPDASFIPEIWQGHKNSGAGFWYALDKLEKWFGRGKKFPDEIQHR